MNSTDTEKTVKRHIFGKVFAAISCILLLCAAFYLFLRPKTYTRPVYLVYQEASEGLNPNGTRYDPYLILSDEVLAPVEEKYGADIRKHVSVQPAENTKGSLIATEYTISCNGLESCPAILEEIGENYLAYFESHYTMNDSILHYEKPDKDIDYIEYADHLEKEVNKVNAFITKQIKKDGNWYSEKGTSYQDLLAYGSNILDIDIANFRTYITENGVSQGADKTRSTYMYRNLLLENDWKKANSQYENRRAAIKLYDPTLFPTISVPSIKSGEYYVTTTKTGLDYIYDAASSFSKTSHLLRNSISENDLIIRNMKTSNEDATANEMAEDIEKKIETLISRVKETNSEYKESKRTQYILFGEVKP